MKRPFPAALLLLPFVAVTVAGPQTSQEERPPHGHGMMGQHGQGMMGQGMSAPCREMMVMHEEMMSQMKASQEQLDKLMRDMEAARGEAKMQAMEAVIKELVAQRMTSRMMSMQPRMMGLMMQQMHQSMQQDREPGEDCPMMRQMMRGQTPRGQEPGGRMPESQP